MLIVLPVFFALRRTPFWIPWLLAASYFFYGWWNPYYLLLVIYSTALDYLLVTLMDHCPRERDSSPPPSVPLPSEGADQDNLLSYGIDPAFIISVLTSPQV